jgi:hypothetical protein
MEILRLVAEMVGRGWTVTFPPISDRTFEVRATKGIHKRGHAWQPTESLTSLAQAIEEVAKLTSIVDTCAQNSTNFAGGVV